MKERLKKNLRAEMGRSLWLEPVMKWTVHGKPGKFSREKRNGRPTTVSSRILKEMKRQILE